MGLERALLHAQEHSRAAENNLGLNRPRNGKTLTPEITSKPRLICLDKIDHAKVGLGALGGIKGTESNQVLVRLADLSGQDHLMEAKLVPFQLCLIVRHDENVAFLRPVNRSEIIALQRLLDALEAPLDMRKVVRGQLGATHPRA